MLCDNSLDPCPVCLQLPWNTESKREFACKFVDFLIQYPKRWPRHGNHVILTLVSTSVQLEWLSSSIESDARRFLFPKTKSYGKKTQEYRDTRALHYEHTIFQGRTKSLLPFFLYISKPRVSLCTKNIKTKHLLVTFSFGLFLYLEWMLVISC